MNILDRIIDLLDTVDQKQLTDYLGLKKTAFTDWKSGKSNSYRKYLVEADCLNVSLDYLVYGKESTDTLSDDVKELLAYYNNLSDIDRGKLLGKAETLAELAAERAAKDRAAEQLQKATKIAAPADGRLEPEDGEPEQNEEYYIDLCSLPASARSGVQLNVQIRPATIAKRANYAVRVSGDSMDDTYYDGDIVLVDTCPDVAIGIFIVNDQNYIKQRGENKLISLNPEAPDVSIHDGDIVYCRGRVLGKAEVIE